MVSGVRGGKLTRPCHLLESEVKKAEKEYLDKVANLGCIVCRNLGHHGTPAAIHHIGNGTMGKRASNFDVIPLCGYHHQSGPVGHAVHAGRKSFAENHGTEQELLEQVRGLLNG